MTRRNLKVGELTDDTVKAIREARHPSEIQYALVAYIVETEEGKGDFSSARLLVYAPFDSRQAAHDYADEFGGTWNGYNIVRINKPTY